MIELDGFSLRPLTGDDYALIQPLLEATPREIFELPMSEAAFRGFLLQVERRPWSMPMISTMDGRPKAAFILSPASPKNSHAYLLALMAHAEQCVLPLGLYVRQAFWSYPLHRLYVQLPVTPASRPHSDAFMAAGFVSEGVLAGHILAGSHAQDASVLGLLRQDFDAWCAAHEPRLSMS